MPPPPLPAPQLTPLPLLHVGGISKAVVIAPDDVTKIASKPCTSQQANDASEELCQDWCSQPKHCAFCKCTACKMCDAMHPPPVQALSPPPSPPRPAPSTLSPTERGTTNHATAACAQQRCHDKKCNPGKSTDCDSCTCQGCPFCQVLDPRRTGDTTVRTLNDCSWLQALRDLRAKQSFCYMMSGTDRLTCESNYVPTASRHLKDGLMTWRRCMWIPNSTDASAGGECFVGQLFSCAPPAPPRPSAPPLPLPLDPLPPPPAIAACNPVNEHDVSTVSCLSWCSPHASRAHCAYCSCSGCGFCQKRDNSAAAPVSQQYAEPQETCAERLKHAGLVDAHHKSDGPQWCFHFDNDPAACMRHYVTKDEGAFRCKHAQDADGPHCRVSTSPECVDG
eukprot:CAMPEP_0174751982 /NCGR_PEP_ID=MMETSP1094-20130205/101021_1 /TAXON_ID=156173 /ORGANISM="Chrysochromulina brevifilum, Strain UTEX LB 985" /LENGTH=391 /DNA_ID=CAMNT_0015957555 /DNA_START=79 /DNA_END=1254 /DNA_ORIENTATION=+